ncbi:hypothetical protein LXA43DRAFT_1103027 [Ganoderma leucocontextum]|nr:hypothetical protein LXA43DRAFT_1103027 [Ganoderma leucocontextum]
MQTLHARAYEPRLKGEKGGKDKDKAEDEDDATAKTATLWYYGMLAEVDLPSVVAPALEGAPAAHAGEAGGA